MTNKRKNKGGTLLGIFIGMAVGVVISFVIAWFFMKGEQPFQNKAAQQGGADANKTSPAAQKNGTPAALPGKPGDKTGERPRFEFYKILPGQDEQTQTQTQTPKPGQPDPTQATKEPLFLQLGAFQNPTDADNLKAKLALMGLEAGVQQVNVPEKGMMYRVRLGPYTKPEEMNGVRASLAQSGIQANVVKAKDY